MKNEGQETTSGDFDPTASNILCKSADTPDWSTLSQDIVCPLCEYNLRGLAEPRCPECGYRFQWADLLDPSRRMHPYLFEQHPESNFASFWKTAFHGLRSKKFWTTIRADQPLVPRRLFAYWLIVATVTFIAIASEYLLHGYAYHLKIVGQLKVLASFSRFSRFPPPKFIWPREEFYFAFILTILVLAWPWVTFMALMVFQISMRRAKISAAHVARCVIYCVDVTLWTSIIAIVTNLGRAFSLYIDSRSGSGVAYSYHWTPYTYAVFYLVVIVFAGRMMDAYRRYLRFPHATATILLSQLITLLFSGAVLLYYGWWLHL